MIWQESMRKPKLLEKIVTFIRSNALFMVLFTVIISVLLFTLNKELLWDWDECIYASFAREMHNSGHFLTNFFNGEPILDKIPFYTVLLQIPLFFTNADFGMRLISIFFSGILISAMYVFVKKKFNTSVALFAVLLFITSGIAVRYFGKISTDIPYSAMLFMAYSLISIGKKNYINALLTGLFIGVAILIKGFSVFPFLLGLIIIIWLFEREKRIGRTIVVLTGLTVSIVPWLTSLYILYGKQFIDVYFLENIIQRARYPIEFHFGGRLFYVKLLLREYFPWILLAFFWPISVLLDKRNFKDLITFIKKEQKIIELLLFILLPFVFLTLSKTKIEWYAIPMMPFLVIYLSYVLHRILENFRVGKGILYCFFAIIIVQGFYILGKDTKLFVDRVSVNSRHQIAIDASKLPEKKLEYLVQFPERRAKEILNPTLYTSFTWKYGGNACAVYYSRKRIHYYYSVFDFTKRLKRGDGLFLIQNGDTGLLQGLRYTIIKKNSDFTLFRVLE